MSILSLFTTTLVLTLVSLLLFMMQLKRIRLTQSIREDGPKTHLKKVGTPTMGGLCLVFSFVVMMLFNADRSNVLFYPTLLLIISYAGIGLLDDAKKIIFKNSKGLSGRWKLFWQVTIALVIMFWLNIQGALDTRIPIPFTADLYLDLPIYAYITFAIFVLVGASNAVNLTDGLDGLAILPIGLVALAFGWIAYATHLNFWITPCLITFAVSMGFLWFNAQPAAIFMGDVGSLSFGGLLGFIALTINQPLLLAIMGGLFVIEAVSVILQVGSFKLTGKRIFKMAPLHHHFELLGWPESKVIVRAWLLTIFLIIVGLSGAEILHV